MKIEITEAEQQFLINIMLKEIEAVNKTRQRFNVFDENSDNAKYFKESFWQLDKFVHSIYNKLIGEN